MTFLSLIGSAQQIHRHRHQHHRRFRNCEKKEYGTTPMLGVNKVSKGRMEYMEALGSPRLGFAEAASTDFPFEGSFVFASLQIQTGPCRNIQPESRFKSTARENVTVLADEVIKVNRLRPVGEIG